MVTHRCCTGHILKLKAAENARLFVSLESSELFTKTWATQEESDNPDGVLMFLQKAFLWAVMGW